MITETGNFTLTSDNQTGHPFYLFSKTNFKLLKFKKRKLVKSAPGFYVKMEHIRQSGRTRTEVIPFDKFKDDYLIQHLPIFPERGAHLKISLALLSGNQYISLQDYADLNINNNPKATAVKLKKMEIVLHYSLYFF